MVTRFVPLIAAELDADTALRQFEPADAEQYFELIDRNRADLRVWLPWVDLTLAPPQCGELHRHDAGKSSSQKRV